MPTKVVKPTASEADQFDLLEGRIRKTVALVERLRAENARLGEEAARHIEERARLGDEMSRLTREVSEVRARLAEADARVARLEAERLDRERVTVEISTLREERELIRGKVAGMLEQLEALNL